MPTENTTAATIYRERKQLVSRPGPQARWHYTYRVDSGPNAQYGLIDYGTCLTDLRAMLRRRGFAITETWKV